MSLPASPFANATATTRRHFLGAAAVSTLWWLTGCRRDEAQSEAPIPVPPAERWRAKAEQALVRAADWLWAKQRQNGAFPSSTYGLLRDGQSLTPFSLLALLQVAPELHEFPPERAGKAIVKMIRLSTPQGALGLANPSLDYPCYATGMMLTCLGLARPEGWAEAASISSTWLRGQQFRSAAGWAGHPAQGGWGLGGRDRRVPPDAGHVDLSMTRVVLEGLRSIHIDATDPAIVEARDFVSRCQTADGSFIYSPVDLALNKAGRDFHGTARGYGSATTDGLLSLIAVGAGPDDESLRKAAAWLRSHHRVDANPGLEDGPMQPFARAMRGYYRAGAAECFLLMGGPKDWRPKLCEAIAVEQRDDGHFENPSPLQKEDAPIVATGFAIRALAAALRPEPA